MARRASAERWLEEQALRGGSWATSEHLGGRDPMRAWSIPTCTPGLQSFVTRAGGTLHGRT